MRLIDADALDKQVVLYEKAIGKGVEWEEFEPTFKLLAKVRRLILQAPTIDATTAHWKSSEQGIWCSRCRVESIFESDYCPNCGAKMDGGKNEID